MGISGEAMERSTEVRTQKRKRPLRGGPLMQTDIKERKVAKSKKKPGKGGKKC